MAIPSYVPVDKNVPNRKYVAPKRLGEVWEPDRAGELIQRGQPFGPRLGVQGPDIGYALKLAELARDTWVLEDHEKGDDARTGIAAVAMKRAALFGRAPIMHDVTFAAKVWGFTSAAPVDLIQLRSALFAQISSPHHYHERRVVADLIPQELLAKPLGELDALLPKTWEQLVVAGTQ
ncbi:MAG: hypothetical protein WC184_10020 [Acidimicrobiia bacterium]